MSVLQTLAVVAVLFKLGTEKNQEKTTLFLYYIPHDDAFFWGPSEFLLSRSMRLCVCGRSPMMMSFPCCCCCVCCHCCVMLGALPIFHHQFSATNNRNHHRPPPASPHFLKFECECCVRACVMERGACTAASTAAATLLVRNQSGRVRDAVVEGRIKCLLLKMRFVLICWLLLIHFFCCCPAEPVDPSPSAIDLSFQCLNPQCFQKTSWLLLSLKKS